MRGYKKLWSRRSPRILFVIMALHVVELQHLSTASAVNGFEQSQRCCYLTLSQALYLVDNVKLKSASDKLLRGSMGWRPIPTLLI